MARTVRLSAPKSMALHKMSVDEVKEVVTREASKALERLPKDFRPIGVNSVSLESVQRGGADWGVWAEWTRACCDKRSLIDDFSDPVEQILPEAAQRLDAAELDASLHVQRIKLGSTHSAERKRRQ